MIRSNYISEESEDYVMPSKGELVEYKPGLFGIQPPKNYGIYIRRYRHKNSKTHMVELYTVKGTQQTAEKNIENKSLGKSLQLKNDRLPDSKILKGRLKTWIMEIESERSKMAEAAEKAGKFSERALWVKLKETDRLDGEYSYEDFASIWYEIDIEHISKKRLSRIREELKGCRPYGQGYFDLVKGKDKHWQPISEDQFKDVKKEISELGNLKNNMFKIIEVPVEDDESDEEETEMQRVPVEWDEVPLSRSQEDLVTKIHEIMEYFVINDNWPEYGLGGTHIYALDGFSMRSYLSYLAEDWIDEGRTSYADAFVKFLIRTGYWTDSDALLAISRRQVKLAPHFQWETEERIEEIAARFKEPKETPEVFENRTDLRELESYTIDPPTAKDFDDAVSLEEKDDEYVLWVHIADVAHYVQKDTSLDLHARRRSTSVYLPTRTIPMLPTHLSDNLCSLVEQVPRLAMSVEIHYDKAGNKLLDRCKVHNAVILVNENLSYDYVNQAIENKKQPFDSLNQFAQLLQTHRRGLALETDDVRLELGGQMALSVKSSSASTKMIETFMVAANETVAEILQKNELPVVYRNHPLPDKEDVAKFNAQADIVGLDYEIEYPDFSDDEEEEDTGQSLMDMLSSSDKMSGGGSISFTLGSGTDFADEMKKKLQDKKEEEQEEEETDLGTPFVNGLAQLTPEQQEEILKPFRDVLEIVEKIDDEAQKKLGYITVLRTLSRALYGAGNMGHFGLGSTAYLHFTSPIRRYPDIIAHRVCKAMIAAEELVYQAEEIDEIAMHCTEQSEIAERLEKTIVGAGFSFLTRNPEYTDNNQGIVVSIFGGGVFVLLPNGIEARIPLSKMTDKPTFVDDYETMCFVGSRSDHNVRDEITPENWKELLKEGDEPVEVITKIGDKVTVDFIGWNHVEGKVDAAPVRILERVDGQYIEKHLEKLEEEEE